MSSRSNQNKKRTSENTTGSYNSPENGGFSYPSMPYSTNFHNGSASYYSQSGDSRNLSSLSEFVADSSLEIHDPSSNSRERMRPESNAGQDSKRARLDVQPNPMMMNPMMMMMAMYMMGSQMASTNTMPSTVPVPSSSKKPAHHDTIQPRATEAKKAVQQKPVRNYTEEEVIILQELQRIKHPYVFPIPPLPILRGSSGRGSTKLRVQTSGDGEEAGLPAGSNNVATAQFSIAYKVSTGPQYHCPCCVKKHAEIWNDPINQAKMNLAAHAIQNGLIDVVESDTSALEGVTGLSSSVLRRAASVASRWSLHGSIGALLAGARHTTKVHVSPYVAAEAREFSNEFSSLLTVGGGLYPQVHLSARARFLRELALGTLTFHVSLERRRIWVLLCGEWDRRDENGKALLEQTRNLLLASLKGELVGTAEESLLRRMDTHAASVRARATINYSSINRTGSSSKTVQSPASAPHSTAGGSPSVGSASGHDGFSFPANYFNEGVGSPLERLGLMNPFNSAGAASSSPQPFHIVLVDVSRYIELTEPMEVPDSEEITPTTTGSTGASSGGVATPPGVPPFFVIPARIDARKPLTFGGFACPYEEAEPDSLLSSSAGAVSTGTADRSLRARANGGATIAKHNFSPQDAFRALLRHHYIAPHFIEEQASKGRCVYSMGTVPRSSFFCEYGGQLVSAATGSDREAIYGSSDDVGCYSYFFKHPQTGAEHCVDATAERAEYGIGRILSHSKKNPNLSTRAIVVDGIPRLVLCAKSEIPFGTELLFDYGERNKFVTQSFEWLNQ